MLSLSFCICCHIILWSFAICDNTFTVWSDNLDTINHINSNWITTGSTNTIHSNHCPSSNNCLQIHSQSSVTTSVSTNNYLNFTLIFGISIIDKSVTQNHHDFCQIHYIINTVSTNTPTNWNLLTSYVYDTTTDFNNKLPYQSYKIPFSNNQYYDSIDIQIINTANISENNTFCFIDQISLIADYYNSPTQPFTLQTIYIVISVLGAVICALFICLLWIYFHFMKKHEYKSQLENIESLKLNTKRVLSISTAGKTPLSTGRPTPTLNTPISADLVGYHAQKSTHDEASLLENLDPVNEFHAKNNKSLSKIEQIAKQITDSDTHENSNIDDNMSDNMVNTAEAELHDAFNNENDTVDIAPKSEPMRTRVSATNTQIKLDNIMDEVLYDDIKTQTIKEEPVHGSVPSVVQLTQQNNMKTNNTNNATNSMLSRIDTDRENDHLPLTEYDLYEETINNKTTTPTPYNDELDFKSVNVSNTNSNVESFQSSTILRMPNNRSQTFNTITTYNTIRTLKEQNEDNSLSFADNESFVSTHGLKNRYPNNKSPMSNGLSFNNNNNTLNGIPEMLLLNGVTVTEDEESKTIHAYAGKNSVIPDQDYVQFVGYFDDGRNKVNNKVRFTKYTQNEEEESLDIGSMMTTHTMVYENNCNIPPLPDNNELSFKSQKL